MPTSAGHERNPYQHNPSNQQNLRNPLARYNNKELSHHHGRTIPPNHTALYKRNHQTKSIRQLRPHLSLHTTQFRRQQRQRHLTRHIRKLIRNGTKNIKHSLRRSTIQLSRMRQTRVRPLSFTQQQRPRPIRILHPIISHHDIKSTGNRIISNANTLPHLKRTKLSHSVRLNQKTTLPRLRRVGLTLPIKTNMITSATRTRRTNRRSLNQTRVKSERNSQPRSTSLIFNKRQTTIPKVHDTQLINNRTVTLPLKILRIRHHPTIRHNSLTRNRIFTTRTNNPPIRTHLNRTRPNPTSQVHTTAHTHSEPIGRHRIHSQHPHPINGRRIVNQNIILISNLLSTPRPRHLNIGTIITKNIHNSNHRVIGTNRNRKHVLSLAPVSTYQNHNTEQQQAGPIFYSYRHPTHTCTTHSTLFTKQSQSIPSHSKT